MKYLPFLLLMFVLHTSCTKIETSELPLNKLEDPNYDIVTIDSVSVTLNSGNYRSIRVDFTRHLDELTPNQQAGIKKLTYFENGLRRGTFNATQNYFVRQDILVGTKLDWQFVPVLLNDSLGIKGRVFSYTVQ